MSGNLRRIARYEVESELGGGGMGTVYLARDPELGRHVAIKLIQAQLDSPDLRERFSREARTVANLNHPHIVTVYDSGQFNDRPYLVLEFIRGRSLAQIIANREAVGFGARLKWIEELCDGLDFAHQAGIIHRDIKPANAMVDHLERLKILDFGIARITGAVRTAITGAIGTPAYMAPEYIRGDPPDHRIDVFAAGAVAYELLTYRPAFTGETIAQIMHRVLEKEPEGLGLSDTTLFGADVERVVLRALEKDPARRYPRARDFAAAIRDLRSNIERHGTPPFAATRIATTDELPRRRDSSGTPGRLSGGPLPPATPGRPALDASAVKRRRETLIKQALGRAEEALNAGRLDEAMAACIEAATLDEALPETVALTARVRGAIDRRDADALLDQARQKVAIGDLTAADDLIRNARALGADPHVTAAVETDIRRIRNERELARQRAIDFQKRIAESRSALASGDLSAALARVDQALLIDPNASQARDLRSAVQSQIAERARIEEEDRRAREIVESARQRFAQGDYQVALDDLWAHQPPHALVLSAAEELSQELSEIRLREYEEQRRVQLELARQRAIEEELESQRDDDIGATIVRDVEPTIVVTRVASTAVKSPVLDDTIVSGGGVDEASVEEPVDDVVESPPTIAVQARPEERPEAWTDAPLTIPVAPPNVVSSAAAPVVKPAAPSRTRVPIALVAGAVVVVAAVVAFVLTQPRPESPANSRVVDSSAPEPAAPAKPENSPGPAPAPASPVTTGTPATPPTATGIAEGAVIIDARPWAVIESITDQSKNTVPVRAGSYTPIRLSLRAGVYRVVLRNQGLNQARTLTVTVQPGQIATSRADFGAVDVDEYFRSEVLNGSPSR